MENYIVSIDSIFRNHKYYPTPQQFTYYLPDEIKNVNYIRLSSIELPTCYPTFTHIKDNISFEILIDDNGELLGETITIEPGIYQSLTDIVDEINNKITLSQLSSYGLDINATLVVIDGIEKLVFQEASENNFIINFSSNNHPYKYVLNNKTVSTTSINTLSTSTVNLSKYINESIISNDSRIEFPSKENYNVKNPPLGYYLGFRKKIYSGNFIYTSDTKMILNKDKYIYVKINDYGKLITNHGDDRYIAKIILNDKNSNFIFDDEQNKLSKRYTFNNPINIKDIKISLHDPYGDIMDTNLQDFSLTIELGVISSSTLREQLHRAFP